MIGAPAVILAAVEFGIRKHSYRHGKILSSVIVIYPILLCIIYSFFGSSYPQHKIEKNNPDPSVYKVQGYDMNLIYEGYEDGLYKFDVPPMGSEIHGEMWVSGPEGLDTDIELGDRCYFYYSEDEKISDDQYNEHQVFSCKAVKICLHDPQEEDIQFELSSLIILHEFFMFIVTVICVVRRWKKEDRRKGRDIRKQDEIQ